MVYKGLLIAVVTLTMVLAVSGCTFPGADVFQVNKPVTKVGTGDILAIKDVRTIPYSPILPDEDVTLEFILENLDEEKTAYDVYVDLYDPAFMKCGTCLPVDGKCTYTNPCSILPLDQEQIFFNIRSPTEADIAGITSSSQVSFRVVYVGEGGTNLDLVVANYDEIERAQRTGQTITATSSKSLGSGPVELEAELLNRDYALSGKTATLKFQVVDRGSYGGSIKNSKIEKGAIVIDFSSLGDINILPPGASYDYNSYYSDQGNIITEEEFEERVVSRRDDTEDSGEDSSLWDTYKYYEGIGENILEELGLIESTVVDSPTKILDFNEILSGLVAGDITGLEIDDDYGRGRGGRPIGPDDFGTTGSDVSVSAKKFDCSRETTLSGGVVCYNTDEINLISGKSSALIFKIDNLPDVGIFRTFQIRAYISYDYELRDYITLEVKPYGS